MDDDDVIFVESNECQKPTDGPLVELLKCLIINDSKQIAVLTNVQIINILEKEFDVDVQEISNLEVDIYMNIVKKYLLEWTGWNGLADINLMNKNKDELNCIVEKKYVHLKNYLYIKLEIAKWLASSVLEDIPQKKPDQPAKAKNVSKDDIVMEIEATRAQLDNLIFRQPVNNSIFNCETTPEYYNHCNLTLDSILNWGGVNVEIKIQWCQSNVLLFKYENRHKLQHILVNKKLQTKQQKSELNQQWQVKFNKTDLKNRMNKISKGDILEAFEQYILNRKSKENKPVITSMCKMLANITKNMPSSISIPADFRKYLSEHCFVRNLYKDVNNEIAINDEKYDLQLKEIISPMCQFHIGIYPMQGQEDSVEIHCTICQLTLTGANVVSDIENHFKTSHNDEPDWRCMNCNETIVMSNLTKMNWQHRCN